MTDDHETGDDLRRRLADVETRLARLEAEARRDAEPPPLPTTSPPIEPAPLATHLRERRDAAREAHSPTPPPLPTVQPPPLPSPPIRSRPAASRASATPLELLVGGKWMAWAGAAIVVAAVGFFLKLGYDREWWTLVSPATRCIMGACFGGLLMVAGELALRKIGRAAAVGLYGAGLTTVYLVAWSASAFFDPPLIATEVSFGLMGLIAVGGVAITLRTRSLSIGVLSIVGGYAAPLLASGASAADIVLLAYLTMLLGIGLVLSALRPRDYRPLRYVAMGAHALITFTWLATIGPGQWFTALFFSTAWWCMVVAESAWAALRRQSALGNVAATLLATAAYVSAGTWVFQHIKPPGFNWQGIFTAAVGVVGIAVVFVLASGAAVLRGQLRTSMDKLALALWVQGGVLAVVAVALQFTGAAETIGWLALSLGAIELARRLPSRGVGWFGAVVGSLAFGRYMLVDWWVVASLRRQLTTIGAFDVTGWILLGLLVIAAAQVSARRLGIASERLPAFRPWRIVPVLAVQLGTLTWLVVTTAANPDLPGTAAWLVAPIALLACERYGRPLRYLEVAIGALVATCARWTFADAAVPALDRWTDAGTLLVTPRLGLAVIIAGALVWAFMIARRRADIPVGRAGWLPVIAAIFLLVAVSFEIDRVLLSVEASLAWAPFQLRVLAWTALWAAGGLAMLAAGRRWSIGPLASSAWAVSLLAAILWLTAGTLIYRFTDGVAPATIIVNAQFGAGLVIAAALAVATRLARRGAGVVPPAVPKIAIACIGAIGLWAGSLEIDRFLDGAIAVQTGLSIYWSLYAIMFVILGFVRRSAAARYAGLGLLVFTVLKVLLVDMSQVAQLWRVASFAVSGLLLIATSVVYAKLAPKLLSPEHAEPR